MGNISNFTELRNKQTVKEEISKFYVDTMYSVSIESVLTDAEVDVMNKLLYKAIRNIESSEKEFYKKVR
jgi:hypothetical protein